MKIRVLFFICLFNGFLFSETGIRMVAGIFEARYFNNIVDRPVLYSNGILFTYLGKKGDKVYLSGDFNDWQKKIKLVSNELGIYYVLFRGDIKKGVYRYRFLVNDYWINDPDQAKTSINPSGSRVSTFEITKDLAFSIKNPQKVGSQVYRFYLPDKNYRKVYWLSNENHWDFRANPMTKKGGFWIIDKNLFEMNLFYVFWADGQYVLDPFNPSLANSGFGLTVNVFEIKNQ